MTHIEAPTITNRAGRVQRRKPDRQSAFRRILLRGRRAVLDLRVVYFRSLGMTIGDDTQISMKARLDRTNPRGVHIGRGTLIAFDVTILTHDLARVLHTDTFIGENCFIGTRATILPGVRIGNQSIVAAGSVVTTDIPSGCIVAGNPARVIKSGIRTMKWGVLEDAYREAVVLNG